MEHDSATASNSTPEFSTEDPTPETESPDQATSVSESLKPPDQLTWPVVLATLFTSFGCINFGFALGWSNCDYSSDEKLSDFSVQQEQWIPSILTIGAILGTFIGADWSDRFGRRMTLIVTAVVGNVGWICVALASDFVLLALGRLALGISIGLINTASPPYIAEITPPTFRGVTGGSFQNGVNGGIFICLLVTPYVDWRTLSAIGLAFGSLMGLGLLFMKESPVWLLSNGLYEQYEKSALFFAGHGHVLYTDIGSPLSEGEAETIELNFVQKWQKLLKDPRMYKPLLLCLFIALAFQLSAVTIITFYNVSIFLEAGLTSEKANLSSQLLGFFQLMVGVAGSIMSSKWRRKPHFLVTNYLTSFGLLCISVSFLLRDNFFDTNIVSYAIIASFVFTISIFAFGAGTITWAYVGELLPAEGTGFVVGAASFMNWFIGFFITFYYPQMENLMSDYGVFFFFTATHFLCTCLLVWLPETKGMSLAEIQCSFSTRKRNNRKRVLRRYEELENSLN